MADSERKMDVGDLVHDSIGPLFTDPGSTKRGYMALTTAQATIGPLDPGLYRLSVSVATWCKQADTSVNAAVTVRTAGHRLVMPGETLVQIVAGQQYIGFKRDPDEADGHGEIGICNPDQIS